MQETEDSFESENVMKICDHYVDQLENSHAIATIAKF